MVTSGLEVLLRAISVSVVLLELGSVMISTAHVAIEGHRNDALKFKEDADLTPPPHWPRPTSSAITKTHILGLGLAHPNIYPIYDLLERIK
ncbi:hypothetical protein STEG23_028807 [Scotinomys teguina]